MDKNKASGPDGIPIEFYQHCWGILKYDVLEMFADFYDGTLDIRRLNYGIITLLPKSKDARKIQKYRPICLLKCIYKWFSKCLTLRLYAVAGRLIHKSRAAFLQKINIMNNVLALHEILHETKRKQHTWVILKLDFEKAYDKVN
jgi:hypothetical protein